MPDPFATIYQLALRALEEQERQVTALHGRVAPVVAAVGVAATLLAPAAFRGDRPNGLLATTVASVGLAGAIVTLLAAAYVLTPHRLRFGIDASAAVAVIGHRPGWDGGRTFHLLAIVGLDQLRVENALRIQRLHTAFNLMLCGMLVAVCGLSVAAAVA